MPRTPLVPLTVPRLVPLLTSPKSEVFVTSSSGETVRGIVLRQPYPR
jgi:hypothetical protein